jgi:hypothetical protein
MSFSEYSLSDNRMSIRKQTLIFFLLIGFSSCLPRFYMMYKFETGFSFLMFGVYFILFGVLAGFGFMIGQLIMKNPIPVKHLITSSLLVYFAGYGADFLISIALSMNALSVFFHLGFVLIFSLCTPILWGLVFNKKKSNW